LTANLSPLCVIVIVANAVHAVMSDEAGGRGGSGS
jgi:hypothetical protein